MRALSYLIALSLLFGMLDAKSQESPINGKHHHKTYRSNDSITLHNFHALLDSRSDSLNISRGRYNLQLMNKMMLAPQSSVKGEEKHFVVTGEFILNIASTGTTCEASNGSFDVVASGGTAPYTYSENGYPPQNTGYFADKAPGTYNVTAIDAAGASTTATIVLPNTLDKPSVNIIGYTQLSSCSSSDATLTLAGSGGLPPYTYSVDGFNFQSNSTISNLPASYGYYGIFIKDMNGCLNSFYGGFGFDNPGGCPIWFQIGGYNASCINEGTLAIYNVSGGTAPYQYSLDGINYQASSTFTNLSSGLYKAYVKDATGFVQMKSSPIGQYCAIVVNIDADSPPCGMSGGSFSVTASFGAPPYKYSIDGNSYQTSNVFNDLKAGRYTVTVVDANGAYSTVDAAIDNSCLAISTSSTNEDCSQKNGSIEIIADNGVPPYQYSIDGINYQPGNTFSDLASGQYALTVKDALGESAGATAIVSSSCLDIDLSAANTTCSKNNGSITAAVSNGTAPYQYSIDGINFQTGSTFQDLFAGDYTVTVKDASGILATSAITISDISGPILSPVLSQASCSNINGSIRIVRYEGTGSVQFSINGGKTLQPDSIFNDLDSGQYIAYAQDANGCITTDTVYLTALPSPAVSLGNDTVLCNGKNLLLTVPNDLGYACTWQDNSNGYSYTVIAAGSYSVKVTNQYNCSATASINVKYTDLPIFSLGNDTVLCNGKTLLLQPAPSPSGSLTWSDGSTSGSLKINAAGSYWLKLSNGGCAKSDSINISYKPAPIIDLGNDTVLCDGQTLLLDATNNNATYLWQDGSSQSTFEASTSGDYTVKVDENGCDTSGKITVSYIAKPVIDLIKDITLCVTQELLLDASYPNSTYEWQDGSSQPQYKVIKEGTYKVQVTNICGSTSDSTMVSFENCACKFYVASAFTPNNDGKNDVFLPKYECLFSNYELRVFNRYGQLVFVSRNASNGWNGVFNGSDQPTGTYVWQLSYKDDLTGKDMRKNGTVVLIR